MAAPIGNQNAKKDGEIVSEVVHIRVTLTEKREWREAAIKEGKTLTRWIRETLEKEKARVARK